MTDQELKIFGELLHKYATASLTDKERALLDELRAKQRSEFSPEQDEALRKAARRAAGI